MIETAQIAKRFAQAQQSYTQQATAQLQVAQQLNQLIHAHVPMQKLQNVLEIGCGSGLFTQQMLQYSELKQVYLNDLYPEVKQYFAQDLRLKWCIGDIEQLELPQSLDGVFSCSALQWMKDLEHLSQRIYNALNSDGYFCFASYAEQNLKEIKALTGQGLQYLNCDQVVHLLERVGFDVLHSEYQGIELYFDHPYAVLKHIKATGVHATAQGFRWTKTSLNQFCQDYQKFRHQESGQYVLTYHPIWIIARKK